MSEENETTAGEPLVHMSADDLWRVAQKYHEAMAEEIQMPGDMIGTVAIIFTNLLIGGVLAGLPTEMVDDMFASIRKDVDVGVEAYRNDPTASTIQ